jgi:prepilin-type N-terminal cleavage/methylation domain-containing protein
MSGSTTSNQNGFTIIELMIATTVFAVLLLVVTYGMLSIGRSYYKGITSSGVQNTARAVAEDIGQAIQFGGGAVYTGPGKICIGDRLYSFQLGQRLTTASQHVLLASNVPTSCASDTNPISMSSTTGGDIQELLGQDMRLVHLSVTQSAANTKLYDVKVRIIQGDDDVLIDDLDNTAYPGFDSCKGGISDQFCAASEIKTTVYKRMN